MSQSINNVQTIYGDCNTFLFSNMGGYQVFQCDTPIVTRGLQLCVFVCVCVCVCVCVRERERQRELCLFEYREI